MLFIFPCTAAQLLCIICPWTILGFWLAGFKHLGPENHRSQLPILWASMPNTLSGWASWKSLWMSFSWHSGGELKCSGEHSLRQRKLCQKEVFADAILQMRFVSTPCKIFSANICPSLFTAISFSPTQFSFLE